jgi:hypothetical protein
METVLLRVEQLIFACYLDETDYIRARNLAAMPPYYMILLLLLLLYDIIIII